MKNNSQDIINKKKKVIILLLLFILIIMILIGFIIGSWAYDFVQDFESQGGNVDTSYIDEKINRER